MAGNQVVGEIWILDSSSALDFSIPPPFPGAPAAGSEKNKIVQEEIVSGQFCPRECVNLILIIS